MVHLEALFTRDGISFDHHNNRVRYMILHQKENSMLTFHNSCFPHVINLAAQAIYAALKDGKGLDEQYLLGNVDDANKAALKGVALPKGVTIDGYCHVLKADVLGMSGMFLKIRSFHPISPYLLNLWIVILFSSPSLC